MVLPHTSHSLYFYYKNELFFSCVALMLSRKVVFGQIDYSPNYVKRIIGVWCNYAAHDYCINIASIS